MSGLMFQPRLADLVMAGGKTVTRRLVKDNPRSPWWRERCRLRPGVIVAVQPGRGKTAIGRVRIESVRRIALARLDLFEARLEGFDSVEEFERAWAQINGVYDDAATVWRVAFCVEGGLDVVA